MPELPEIETVRIALSPLVGSQITSASASSFALRWQLSDVELNSLSNLTLINIARRGRHLLIQLSSHQSLLIHLGMSGWIRHEQHYENLKHDHFYLYFKDGSRLVLNDARRFGGVMLSQKLDATDLPIIANLGWEPFNNGLTPAILKSLYNASAKPIKEILMDNALVTGIGNIYASEILFKAGIHPDKKGKRITLANATTLLSLIRSILTAAIASGGSTLRDFKHINGESGKAQNLHQVYAKEGSACPQCSNLIKKSTHGGRSSFFCPQCQKKR